MTKLKAIKIKQSDGTYSDNIPFSVGIQNIEYKDTTLDTVFTDFDLTKGTIQTQLDSKNGSNLSMEVTDDHILKFEKK